MVTKRIQNVDINNRGPYTALYGRISDSFLGEDMKMYNFDQQMYLYLKSSGFDVVVFYSEQRTFYSFQQTELLSFVKLKTQRIEQPTPSGDSFKNSGIKRPLGGNVKPVTTIPNVATIQSSPVKHLDERGDSFFQAVNPHVYDCIKNLLNDNTTRMALVVMSPNISKLALGDNLESLFDDKNRAKDNSFKVIVVYNFKNAGDLIHEFRNNQNSNKTFFSPFFRGQFTQGAASDTGQLTDACIEISLPESAEIGRWIQYKRLITDIKFLASRASLLLKELQAKRLTGRQLKIMMQSDVDQILSKIDKKPTRVLLNELIGLHSVKDSIDTLVSNLEFHKERQKRGITDRNATFNLSYAFMGNPGTGKTTVARLFGQILAEIEVLERGHSVEVTREDLVAGYVGQTAIKTREKIEEALGGVLFIDEAYSLTNKGENDFGHEAVETLLAAMTNPRYQGKMAFVVAGYPDLMQQFLDSNPGLTRRFTKFIHFEDYSSEELSTIFENKLQSQQFTLEAEAKEQATSYFASLPRGNSFGNAGVADKLAAQVIDNLNSRHKKAKKSPKDLSTLELTTIQVVDIPTPLKSSPLPPNPSSTVATPDSGPLTESKRPDSTPPETSLADEIILNYQSDNQDHVFIREVCDEIQEVLVLTIAVYQGEGGFEDALRALENENFKNRVETVSRHKAEINSIQFQEIRNVMEAFRLFFRGILSVNQNDIPSAIKHFNASIPLAKTNQIEDLEQTTIFMSKYCDILLTAQDGDFALIQSKLNDLKNDIELSGVNEHYRQFSDLMQADILFVSALKVLADGDVTRFVDLANQAGDSTEQVVAEYFTGYNNPEAALLGALALFYRALADMVLLFHKIDQEDFSLTRELSNLGINTSGALRHFKKADLESNQRMVNVYYLVQTFAVFESFLRELSIVMLDYKDHGKNPAETSLVKLKTISNDAKQSLTRIHDSSLRPWVEMCDELVEYVHKLEQGEYQPAMKHDFSQLAGQYYGFANDAASDSIDYTNVEMVKQRVLELLPKGRTIEVLEVIEKHLPHIVNKDVYAELLLMTNRFRENRRRWDYKLVSHQDGIVDERSILAAIIQIVLQL